jgi:ABC-type antimicrobial peptide transport system permease subunit
LAAQLSAGNGQAITVNNFEQLTVKFHVVGIQQYYPTLYDSFIRDNQWISDDKNHPFVIVDRDLLLYILNRRPSAALYADEVWLKTASGTDSSAVLKAVQPANDSATVVSAETIGGEMANLQTDPLNLGLLGLMFLAFIIAMSLSVVGLLTYSALTAAARRSEFGVLRALGLSSTRLIMQLAVEQLFVIGLGLVLGGTLGSILSSQIVPKLALDASSKNITPPFIVQVETGALIQYGIVIAVVLGLVLLSTLLLVRQLSLSQTLRLGDE